jgi:outer membrane protein OmpA-like peptidoglycan-associated protein
LQTQVLPIAIKESVLNSKTDANNNSKNNSKNNLATSPTSPTSSTSSTSSTNLNSKANSNSSNNSNTSVSKSLADKSLADKSLADKSLADASGNKSSKNPDKVGDKSSSNSLENNENKLANNSKNNSKSSADTVVNDNSKNRASQLTDDAVGKVAGDRLINNSLKGTNSTTQNKTIDRNGDRPIDRNINTSVLPITNPDLEVTIFFPSDEVQLMQPEEVKIDNFWTKIQGRRGIIQVSGHTDKTGDYAYNLDLSQARANEVVRMLRDRGLDNNYRITFEALSWLQPLRKNNTATDNAFNRRVVIQFKEQR